MDSTLRICLLLGIACFAIAIAGIVSVSFPGLIFLPIHVVIPLNIVSIVLLVPIVYCFVASYKDSKAIKKTASEGSYLLGEQNLLVHQASERIHAYMYASHFLSAWGDRMWRFAMPLLFMEIFVDTLLPSAVFSIIVNIVGFFSIPSLGRWLDHTNRMKIMQTSIAIDNTCVVLSTITLGSILYLISLSWSWNWYLIVLFGLTIVFGALGQIFNDAQTLSIEKDWVVVIADETNSSLVKWNTTMRRIDLTCALLSPSAFGFIMDFAGDDPMTRAAIGAASVGIWNLVAAPLEYTMVRDVYSFVPSLAISGYTGKPKPTVSVVQYFSLWTQYLKHPTFIVSFSFSILNMTVLSGGALNISYLQWRGLPLSLLGVSSGLGALFGLFGTLVFPLILSCLGTVELVGVVSVWLFWFTLAPIGATYLFYGESSFTDYTMVIAVFVSRCWLWSCDLAETQIMQEWVEPDRRGAINAMQSATSKVFFIGVLLVSVFYSDPRQFETLAFVSLGAVGSSAIGFTIWYTFVGKNPN
ncbi:Ferroportin (FP) Family [Thraustotheca clavata]|uniref:Solute carrier family 40 member n=1 Tax=Thraustotheca clavata TaxID=74557 RepID=A0A1W0A8U7_9STRA|nr:Ferroportin (FP) Family [Thraustotheca clavata]